MEQGIGTFLAMNDASIFVALAVVFATLFVYFAARPKRDAAAVDKARALIAALDIQAFRNLVDPEEESFLRSNLRSEQFRIIKRDRAWAALAYVRVLSRLALEFSRFGHALRDSSDPRMVDLGLQMAKSAVNLRLYALETGARLFVVATFPDLPQRWPHLLFEQYAHSSGLLLRYGALDHYRKQYS